ncbi:23S rRNA (uracil(747)-C(5))-methyltransferase RlmC [Frankliniella fusca]|uniref:23S rRNA (Uracil(747)-C(5))-methyltransferase RlmC n=1 Tax=Frankliniella fusca TaxID=407009 RepID=A0AAE1LBD3_9NEOP|nr:23S rRNA (uracil(747)-C(5))-methyltransferase RlmC [Frankliniella fusca]
MAGPGRTALTALAALLVLATANSHLLVKGAGDLQDGAAHLGQLSEEHLVHLLSNDNAHTKLEKWLTEAVYKFRDNMKNSQPDLGLPVLDPFSLVSDKPLVVDSKAAHIDISGYSVLAKSLSSLEVQELSLYLVERTGLVDVTLSKFTADVTVDVGPGSWISPLKIAFNDRLKISFSSPRISLGTRTKITLSGAKLHVQSVKIQLDLGDWEFEITHEGEGTSSHNPGLDALLAALVRDQAPSLIDAWMPVLEKKVTALLDEQLQKVQISDLIPHD